MLFPIDDEHGVAPGAAARDREGRTEGRKEGTRTIRRSTSPPTTSMETESPQPSGATTGVAVGEKVAPGRVGAVVVGAAVGRAVGGVVGAAVGDSAWHATTSCSVPVFRALLNRTSTAKVAPAGRSPTWMATRSLLLPHFFEAPEASMPSTVSTVSGVVSQVENVTLARPPAGTANTAASEPPAPTSTESGGSPQWISMGVGGEIVVAAVVAAGVAVVGPWRRAKVPLANAARNGNACSQSVVGTRYCILSVRGGAVSHACMHGWGQNKRNGEGS